MKSMIEALCVCGIIHAQNSILFSMIAKLTHREYSYVLIKSQQAGQKWLKIKNPSEIIK